MVRTANGWSGQVIEALRRAFSSAPDHAV